jgi:hypothetical protein
VSKQPVDPKVAFIKAFLKLQVALPTLTRTATNEQTDSQYAPLEDVLTPELKALLSKHGFALWHTTHPACVTGVLTHVGGHHISSDFYIKADGRDDLTPTQSFAAAVTMGRRYTTFDVLGLVQSGSDRDGQAQPRAVGNNVVVEVPPEPGGYLIWRDNLEAASEQGRADDFARIWGESYAATFRGHLVTYYPDVYANLRKRVDL